MVKKWFKGIRKNTGWHKNQSASTRRAKALSARPKNQKLRTRILGAGKSLNALANVTRDKVTKQKARADAKYFFRKLKR
jgi:hypothetical protein